METLTRPPLPQLITLPTQDQLPSDDGVPMETQRHKMQADLLIDVLYPWLEQRDNGYVGGNMFVYFSTAQLKNEDFKGPDFFAVLGVAKQERKSWVVWEEEKAPDVVIELLSESTANYDKTEKKQTYQDKLRVPEYFWYDPFNPEDLAGFVLVDGIYQPIELNEQGWLVSKRLELTLVRWKGEYRGVNTVWLRWANLEGEILPNASELAAAAQQKAELAQQELKLAQQEIQLAQQDAQTIQQKADKLAAKLRELGIDPESV